MLLSGVETVKTGTRNTGSFRYMSDSNFISRFLLDGFYVGRAGASEVKIQYFFEKSVITSNERRVCRLL